MRRITQQFRELAESGDLEEYAERAGERLSSEAFRVLKPGGRLAYPISSYAAKCRRIVQKSLELWAGCIAGALRDTDYTSKVKAAGFQAVEVEPTRIYTEKDARQSFSGKGVDLDRIAPQVAGRFMSAFIRATKPVPCCGPACCG